MSDKIVGAVAKAGAYVLLGAASAAVGFAVGLAIVKIVQHIKGKIDVDNIREKLREALQTSKKKKMKKALAGYVRAVVTKKKGNVISFDVLEREGKFAEVKITADEVSDSITEGMTIDYAAGI